MNKAPAKICMIGGRIFPQTGLLSAGIRAGGLPGLTGHEVTIAMKLYQKLVLLMTKSETNMARNTSILLGDYFEKFISEQIASGKYNSVSEVVRTALRVFEKEENKTKLLVSELMKGEKSPKVKDFDRKKNLKDLHAKFLK